MTSTFDTNWTASSGPRASLLAYFGETITYTPRGGSGSSITAVVNRDAIEDVLDDRGDHTIKTVLVTISQADVAAPAVDDSITVDSVTYAVKEIASREGGMADLVCQSTAQTHHSRGSEATIPLPG